MVNLIKMDLRRLSKSLLFKVSLILVAALNILVGFFGPIVVNLIAQSMSNGQKNPDIVTKLSSSISNPFSIPIMFILLFMSVVVFTYADFSHGYVKNLAGQVNKRSSLIFSKFIVVGIHNLIFLAVGSASQVIGAYAGCAGGAKVEVDGLIGAALGTLLIKWMLCMAISAILIFITSGVRNKTLASIVGVVIGTGALGLAYLGINTAIGQLFKQSSFSISDYMPDQLLNMVDVGSNIAVANAIIVAVVCTAIFLALAVKTFNSRDIK